MSIGGLGSYQINYASWSMGQLVAHTTKSLSFLLEFPHPKLFQQAFILCILTSSNWAVWKTYFIAVS